VLQLNSNNYEKVLVIVNDYEKPIEMDVVRGLKLLDHLTKGQAGTHVRLTLEDGTVVGIKTTDIRKVEPIAKMKGLDEYV